MANPGTKPGTKGKKIRSIHMCPACRAENSAESRFCANCAAPLKAAGTAAPDGSRTIRVTAVEMARGNRIAGRYEIIEELGQGGMGRVFRVFDHQVGEIVALKLIRPEIGTQDKAIERFKNELKFTRKITHRNICRMYDLGEVELLHYITMEYVAGEDLKRFVKRAGPLNTGKAVSIAKQVCAGLAEAHRGGAVHRDLKPQNIMIDVEGTPKIMDFGIARFADMDRMTGSGVMIGTPEYMAPEQAELKEVDKRADIYALGCVIFEMLTGRVPFEGETALGLAMKHKMEKPRDVRVLNPQVVAGLAEVVSRCLEKEPARRYQDADELLAALCAVELDLATGERAVPADFLGTPDTGAARPATGPSPAPPAPAARASQPAAASPSSPAAPVSSAVPPAKPASAPTSSAEKSRVPSAAEHDPQAERGTPVAAPAPRTMKAGAGKKPTGLIAAVAGVVVIAIILALTVGQKSKAPAGSGTSAAGGRIQAAVEPGPPSLGDSPEAKAAEEARERMLNVKKAASRAGLDSGAPVIRAAMASEDEASRFASSGDLEAARLAFTVTERIYRVCFELSSDELRLQSLEAFVAEVRGAAEAAINANPEDKSLRQALALEREGLAASIKKNIEQAALARGRAALIYMRIDSAFRAGKK